MKTYSIVGMSYAKAEDFVKSLQAGAAAVILREPNNEHDPNAVAVWIEGRKVGYIPRKENAVLAQFIDQTGADVGDLAMDSAVTGTKYVHGKFIRSPNSGYPQVQL